VLFESLTEVLARSAFSFQSIAVRKVFLTELALNANLAKDLSSRLGIFAFLIYPRFEAVCVNMLNASGTAAWSHQSIFIILFSLEADAALAF
jgi:hypothetical protein